MSNNRTIEFELDENYKIKAEKNNNIVEVTILHNKKIIGKATLITDYIDAACITQINLLDEYINVTLNDQYLLGDAFIKFLIKFPLMARKMEFRFIANCPENLENLIKKYHFDYSADSVFKSEIMLRKDCHKTPSAISLATNFSFYSEILPTQLSDLVLLLQKNAYWQAHLTKERFELLTEHSDCFVALDKETPIGFARVLTDGKTFASLWDVVVDENYRNQGIGTSLMQMIFSSEKLKNIKTFILFTDTAKWLYEKFGFILEDKYNLVAHKFRLQDSPPLYMPELIQLLQEYTDDISLPPNKSLAFLFSEEGKRAKHTQFWRQTFLTHENSHSGVSVIEDHRQDINLNAF